MVVVAELSVVAAFVESAGAVAFTIVDTEAVSDFVSVDSSFGLLLQARQKTSQALSIISAKALLRLKEFSKY